MPGSQSADLIAKWERFEREKPEAARRYLESRPEMQEKLARARRELAVTTSGGQEKASSEDPTGLDQPVYPGQSSRGPTMPAGPQPAAASHAMAHYDEPAPEDRLLTSLTVSDLRRALVAVVLFVAIVIAGFVVFAQNQRVQEERGASFMRVWSTSEFMSDANTYPGSMRNRVDQH